MCVRMSICVHTVLRNKLPAVCHASAETDQTCTRPSTAALSTPELRQKASDQTLRATAKRAAAAPHIDGATAKEGLPDDTHLQFHRRARSHQATQAAPATTRAAGSGSNTMATPGTGHTAVRARSRSRTSGQGHPEARTRASRRPRKVWGHDGVRGGQAAARQMGRQARPLHHCSK